MSALAGRDLGVLGVLGLVMSALLLRLAVLGLDLTGVRTLAGMISSISFLAVLVISDTSSSRCWVSGPMAMWRFSVSSFWILAVLSTDSSESFLLGGGIGWSAVTVCKIRLMKSRLQGVPKIDVGKN